MTKLEITIEGSTEALKGAFPLARRGVGISVWLGPVSIHLSTDRGIQFETSRTWRFGVLAAFRRKPIRKHQHVWDSSGRNGEGFGRCGACGTFRDVR